MNIQDTQKKLDKLLGKCVYLHGGLNSLDDMLVSQGFTSIFEDIWELVSMLNTHDLDFSQGIWKREDGMVVIDFKIPKRVDVARLKLALKAQQVIPFIIQDTLDYMNGVIVKVINVQMYYNNYKRG